MTSHWLASSITTTSKRDVLASKLSATRLPETAGGAGDVEDRLVTLERTQGRNRFRAVRAQCVFRDATVQLPEEAVLALEADDGERLHTIPLE